MLIELTISLRYRGTGTAEPLRGGLFIFNLFDALYPSIAETLFAVFLALILKIPQNKRVFISLPF